MKSVFLANVIKVLHILFVLWCIVIPFTNNEPMLVLHLIVLPMLWLHWITNQDTCALTLIERHLRGVESKDSFFHNVVSPIYVISDNNMRTLAWAVSIALWFVTLSKILKNPGMIKDVFTLKDKSKGKK